MRSELTWVAGEKGHLAGDECGQEEAEHPNWHRERHALGDNRGCVAYSVWMSMVMLTVGNVAGRPPGVWAKVCVPKLKAQRNAPLQHASVQPRNWLQQGAAGA